MMANKKYRVTLFSVGLVALAIVFVFACRKQFMFSAVDSDQAYYTENALVLKKEIGNYYFELKHIPESSTDKDSITHQSFVLKIGVVKGNDILSEGIEDENEYYERLNYFDQEAQIDMKLVDGSDTLSCLLYHFERNYGIAPFNNIVLSFPGRKNQQNSHDKVFIFDDKVLGLGTVKIKIEKELVKKIPIS
ncbi:MAG: hypothetical protein QY303_10325 [Vicingaceae bacterium]|nr:hypothetical protein [Flavobacteriales bacterium]WKZ74537.1 MAG: hypothetical protein QY303_10325 [Vicingaceae bacterium]